MSKIYVVEINGKNIRTLTSEEQIKVGTIIPDEIWLGNKVEGGKVTKVICHD